MKWLFDDDDAINNVELVKIMRIKWAKVYYGLGGSWAWDSDGIEITSVI